MQGLKKVYIYGLLDTEEGIIRYIGASAEPQRRYKEHFCKRQVESNNPKARWIREMFERGKKPDMILLDCVSTSDARAREAFWIDHFKKLGVDLLNHKIKI